MSPVYLLHCSVCEGEFSSKQKWLDHLTQDEHQKLARKEIKHNLINSGLNNFKDCCLVTFTTYNLTVEDAQKIVQYFGSRNQSTLVTDFVWWEDRPRIGIIQFESRKKVDDILTGNQDMSSDGLLIDNQRVQVKRAADFLDLHLKALLPGNHKKSQNMLDPCRPSRKRGRVESQSKDLLPNSKKNCVSSSPHPLSSIHTRNSAVESQYLSIRKLVVIPDTLLSQATQAVSSLKALFSCNDPSADLTVFRTWNLNLTSSLSSSPDDLEDLVVHLYRNVSPSNYSWISREIICSLLHKIEKSPDPKDFTILGKDPDEYTWRLMYTGGGGNTTDSSIPIRLISHKQAMPEVQICRLFKYMMTFDPRFEHALCLLYFWTSANGVTIGTSNLNKKNCHLSLPEPLTMQWLLMHFMCNRKYIPTVREIQKRPHPVLKERLNGIDIGFDEDPKFAEDWKMSRGNILGENLIEGGIYLLLEFFEFCWMTLDGSTCIFNTKDGEVIRTESFLSCEPGAHLAWTTEMTREEVQLLRALHNGNCDSDEKGNKLINIQHKMDLRGWNLYMVHPFIFSRNFSVSWDIGFLVKLMKISEGKLRKFLNEWKCGGMDVVEKRFGKLENVLTVDEKVTKNIWSKTSRKKTWKVDSYKHLF